MGKSIGRVKRALWGKKGGGGSGQSLISSGREGSFWEKQGEIGPRKGGGGRQGKGLEGGGFIALITSALRIGGQSRNCNLSLKGGVLLLWGGGGGSLFSSECTIVYMRGRSLAGEGGRGRNACRPELL